MVDVEELRYPSYDLPLLSAFSGRYECAFVILHPFIALPNSPEVLASYPADRVILDSGKKYSWANVTCNAKLDSYSKVNHALLTQMGALKKQFQDTLAAARLNEFIESQVIWPPVEELFAPLLQSDIIATFGLAEAEEILFKEEISEKGEIEKFSLSEFTNLDVEQFPNCGTLSPSDTSFLLCVDWDSFFTLLYGPLKFVSTVVRERHLEGFFLEPNHYHWWYKQNIPVSLEFDR